MEFNLKTKRWAGDLYHQLESICQEVDGLVNKDTMKSVGTQVQNVGISVKKLYSDVVQDISPLADDILKPKQQLEAGENGDVQDHVSVTGITTTSTYTDEKNLQKNKVSNDQNMRISKPASTPESQNCQYLRDNGDAIVKDSKDSSIAENINTEDSKSLTPSSSFEDEIFSRQSDEDYMCSTGHEKISTSIEKERNQKVDDVFTDDTVCLSETSSTGWFSKRMLSVLKDLYSEGNRNLSSTPVPVSTHEVNQDNCLLMDSPLPPACDADDLLLEKDTKHESIEWPTSDQLPETPSYYLNNGKEQIAIMPSTCCTSPKSPISMESTSADFSKKAENGCNYHISATSSINAADTAKGNVSAGFSEMAGNILHSHNFKFSDISASSFVTVADTTKALDADPSFPILESNDNSASRTNRSEFLNGSSKRVHEEHYKDGLSKIVISPSETEHVLNVTIGDLDLESIDLSPDSKHNSQSVILNSKFALAGSYRRRNFKYYKNLIKGTFTSQKRLSKEYEHLGIMYDDIDVTSNQHFEPSSLPSFPNSALHVAGTQSSQDIDQWELL